MKKIAILQSNYIPWKGYFDLIDSVDEFIVYDTVQYTRRDWRNRNLIKTNKGLSWLSIPVDTKGKYEAKINEINVTNFSWIFTHQNLIMENYRNSLFFTEVMSWLQRLYKEIKDNEIFMLSDINLTFIKEINKKLGIETEIRLSQQFEKKSGKNENLIEICKQCNANIYLSGPAAKSYVNETEFNENGIKVEWMNYSGYPEYDQLFGDFEHGVSIIDVFFNIGFDNAYKMIKKDRE
ncbi:WbqC family protein [Bacillaceae bacterium CLA-AA-H227]|uniref:WbqC family protein n=1 Tax=Robertmurraya yapensis (ex Hitch et al 2024) TaxID=3133160 RepID=A0ACC6SCG7_9BACI